MNKKKYSTIVVEIEGIEIYDGYIQDSEDFGYNMQRETAGVVGSIAGGMAGAWAGAKALGAFGSLFGPIGGLIGLHHRRVFGWLLWQQIFRKKE